MSSKDRRQAILRALLILAAEAVLLIFAVAVAAPGPETTTTTKTVHAAGRIVPIPASIPHEEGDMIDRRILPDLKWIASRFPIYVTDGYSGPLPNGRRAGCNRCHTRNSDHYNGLALDIVPASWSNRCDAKWTAITRLAKWAEPVQNKPRPPFRWVGYDGDSGHGCGHHLHLSWNHAEAAEYQLAEWVEVFPTGLPVPTLAPPSTTPQPAPPGGKAPAPEPTPAPSYPSGGISQVQTGGVAPRGRGD